jgi:uncharacterized protein YbaR (Trm112 family)
VSIDPELRSLLVCPVCRGDLRDVRRGLLCASCALVYPVVDGSPYLVRECALRAEPADLAGGR